MVRSQVRAFAAAGAGLLALAGIYLWRDLAIAPEYLLSVAAAVSAAFAVAAWPRALAWAGAAGLFACAVAGGAWYAAVRADALVPGLALAFAGAVAAAIARRRDTNGMQLGFN